MWLVGRGLGGEEYNRSESCAVYVVAGRFGAVVELILGHSTTGTATSGVAITAGPSRLHTVLSVILLTLAYLIYEFDGSFTREWARVDRRTLLLYCTGLDYV